MDNAGKINKLLGASFGFRPKDGSSKLEYRSTKQYLNSNCPMTKTFWILKFGHTILFRISCLGFPAKGRRLALNWLCFFAAFIHKNLHKSLLLLMLHQFARLANWLCFLFFAYNFIPARLQRFSTDYCPNT